MSKKVVVNLAASVRQRLLNISYQQNEDFGTIVTRFAMERMLHRISLSTEASNFILKGAVLFSLWMDSPHRATHDLDLLRFGQGNIGIVEEIFRSLCLQETQPPDGLIFLPDTVHGMAIREDAVYLGVRIKLGFRLTTLRGELQIDIGVGDAVVPPPEERFLTSLLDFPPIRLKAYPPEATIAEKLHAMVSLDMMNSRMKDFYDLWILAQHFTFNGQILCQAINATFRSRKTPFPQTVPALTERFWSNASKQLQWQAFVRRLGEDKKVALEEVITEIERFLTPPLNALRATSEFPFYWENITGWHA